MPFEVSWYIENRVIYTRGYGVITLDDLADASQLITQEYLSQGTPLIHEIVDLRDMEHIPSNLHKISNVLTYIKHPDYGWTIFVNTNRVMNFIGPMLAKIARIRFRMFDDLDEGLAFLAEQDSSLTGYLGT